MLEPLELQPRRREQALGRLDVPIHRAADVEEQQHLDRVAALRTHLDVEIAVVGGRTDGVVEIELLGRALAREAAQAAQRQADVARSELLVAGEVLEFALVPDLDGARSARALLTHAHAGGIVAVSAEGRSPRRADPFVSALVALALLGKALSQLRQQRFEAERLDLGALLGTQNALDRPAQPFGRDLGRLDAGRGRQRAAKDLGEHDVELVEVALILDQQRARQAIEVLDRLVGEVGLEGPHQVEEFARRHRHARLAQGGEEGEKHASMLGAGAAARNGGWNSIVGQFEFPELAGSGMAAYGSRNGQADIRSRTASRSLSIYVRSPSARRRFEVSPAWRGSKA